MATQSQTKNPWLVLVFLSLGFFMILLDTTIVNIAIPSIISALHSSLDQILWVLNAYLLVYAVLLITAGRLGDFWGPRRLFTIGLVVFTVASAICGLSQDGNQLIAARILQGIGGALLTPQTLTIITTIFPPERRGAAFGIWGAVAGVAAVTGPTLGGFLVTYVDWRWIFYVNVPVGIIALFGAIFVIPDIRPGRRHRLDLIGVLLASAGLFGIVFGLVEGQRYNWGAIWGAITIPEIIAAGVLLFLLFVVFERYQAEPLMPLSLFSNRNFSLMLWVSLIVAFGLLGFFLPLTIFLQSVLGFSALKAGLTFLPMSLISAFVAPFAGRMADRYGGKYILMIGLTIFAAGFALVVAVASLSATQVSFLAPAALAGVGLGMTFAPLTTVALRNIVPQMAGAASGVLNTTRQLGGAMGSAVIGAVLQNQLATQLHDQAVNYSTQVPAAFRPRFVDAFSNAAASGFQVGVGETGGVQLPQGIPAQVAQTLEHLFRLVFDTAYANAVKPSLGVSIVVLAVGALSCVFIQRRARAAAAAAAAAVAQQAPAGPATSAASGWTPGVASGAASSMSAANGRPEASGWAPAAVHAIPSPDGKTAVGESIPQHRRRSVMVLRYIVGLLGSLAVGLAGGWLMLSPWALGVQGSGGWSSTTWSQFSTGAALVALALIGVGLTVGTLVGDLRDAGVLRPRPARSRQPMAASLADDPQAAINLLARALADELDRRERRTQPAAEPPSLEVQR